MRVFESKIVIHFTGWRSVTDPCFAPFTFRCPECKIDFRSQSAHCITCPNCGNGGSKQHFSAVVKVAA